MSISTIVDAIAMVTSVAEVVNVIAMVPTVITFCAPKNIFLFRITLPCVHPIKLRLFSFQRNKKKKKKLMHPKLHGTELDQNHINETEK